MILFEKDVSPTWKTVRFVNTFLIHIDDLDWKLISSIYNPTRNQIETRITDVIEERIEDYDSI